MSEVKYGELADWEDGDVSGLNDFMNLTEGDNNVRIFTNPYQFSVAWIKDQTGANRKLRAAASNCPLVKSGQKVTQRWYLGVLDRDSGQAKILEISSQVYLGIKNLHTNPKWGNVKQYDINIKRNPKGSQPLYQVMPYPKEKPSSEDVSLAKAFLERVNIAQFTQPPTAEEVEKRLAEVLGTAIPNTTVTEEVNKAVTVSAPAEAAQPSVSDDDFDFGDDEL